MVIMLFLIPAIMFAMVPLVLWIKVPIFIPSVYEGEWRVVAGGVFMRVTDVTAEGVRLCDFKRLSIGSVYAGRMYSWAEFVELRRPTGFEICAQMLSCSTGGNPSGNYRFKHPGLGYIAHISTGESGNVMVRDMDGQSWELRSDRFMTHAKAR